MASLESALQSAYPMDVLNYQDPDQLSLLYVAAEHNFVAIANLLLRAKADVNQQYLPFGTALMRAATCGHDEMVGLLLKQPGIALEATDFGNETALISAVVNGHTSIVKRLLHAGAELGNSLLLAPRDGNCEIVKLLLQHKADVHMVDIDGNSCLHNAATRGLTDIVEVLLEANANVDLGNCFGVTPLMRAWFKGHSTVRLLLTVGANPNLCAADGSTVLLRAYHDATIVDDLLKAGADPNAVNEHGRTALYLATQWTGDRSSVMTLLLNGNADINLADNVGDTPLIAALAVRNEACARFLLENGADLLKKGTCSARQMARKKGIAKSLFQCFLCGWEGRCCYKCRKKYCLLECDKFSGERTPKSRIVFSQVFLFNVDPINKSLSTTIDCKLHRQLAHQSVLEWTLAMSSLNLPPYVLEIIFNSLQFNSKRKPYQQRKANDFLWIANNKKAAKIDENFVHLIIEERTHLENIRLFISVHKFVQSK